jgi:glycosyltransferase involved in cell wall biosynthesis
MRVTVAIITKDRPDQLERCLRSLVKQTDKKFNVLIVDSSSSKNTKKIVDSFKKKLNIRYFFENKLGYSNARNRVLQEAKCDILVFTDDDCEATSNWIESIIKAHKEFPGAVAIQGWGISKPSNGAISIIAQFNRESGFKENIKRRKDFFFNFNNHFLDKPSTILLLGTKNASLKIAIIRKLKLKFNTNTIHAEDFEFSKQLLSKGQKIMFYPAILVYHWERSTLGQFFRQRTDVTREITKTQRNWPSVLFPRKKPLWWVERSINFIFYLVKNKHVRKSFILIPLFLAEKTATLLEKNK